MADTPSPMMLVAGAAILGGGYYLFAGDQLAEETTMLDDAGEISTGGTVSFEEATGLDIETVMGGGASDIARTSDGSIDADAQPWLVVPPEDEIIAAVKEATGVEVASLISSEYQTYRATPDAEPDRQVRNAEITFFQPGSTRRWTADIVIRWTETGWTLDRNLTGLGPADHAAPESSEADNG
ncbi:MAG: hypothetical protein AAGF88_04855 [Pseudomonadota bacterium]